MSLIWNSIKIARTLFVRMTVIALCATVVTGCEGTLSKPPTSADDSMDALGLYVRARSNGSVTQAFVSPMNKYGMVRLGPTDKLFIATSEGKEQPFVSFHGGDEWIAQIATTATTFSIVFVRGSKRFVNTVELPPPFMLEAQYRVDLKTGEIAIETRWTPSCAGSEMVLLAEGLAGRFEPPHQQETDAPFGTFTIVRDSLQRPIYATRHQSSSDDVIVTATRTGGHVTLDPAFAKIPTIGTLEQIRTTIVAQPAPVVPPNAIAVDPLP